MNFTEGARTLLAVITDLPTLLDKPYSLPLEDVVAAAMSYCGQKALKKLMTSPRHPTRHA